MVWYDLIMQVGYNRIKVLDAGEWIDDAIIKHCGQCLKKTIHKMECNGCDSHQKGRFTSETWNFFHLMTLGLTYLFIVKPFKREPTYLFYYKDKCIKCGLITNDRERHQLYWYRSQTREGFTIDTLCTIDTLGSS